MKGEEKMPSTSKFLREFFVVMIGWAVCLNFLTGAYLLGWWLAPHLGWTGNREILGLLSAITLVWIYEHRHFETKLDKLHKQ